MPVGRIAGRAPQSAVDARRRARCGMRPPNIGIKRHAHIGFAIEYPDGFGSRFGVSVGDVGERHQGGNSPTGSASCPRKSTAGCVALRTPKRHKKPAFYAGLVEVIGSLRILSDLSNGGAGGNRTPVHKSYATRSTYVATSIVLAAHYPTGRESMQPARCFFVEHTPGTCAPLADERYT